MTETLRRSASHRPNSASPRKREWRPTRSSDRPPPAPIARAGGWLHEWQSAQTADAEARRWRDSRRRPETTLRKGGGALSSDQLVGAVDRAGGGGDSMGPSRI